MRHRMTACVLVLTLAVGLGLGLCDGRLSGAEKTGAEKNRAEQNSSSPGVKFSYTLDKAAQITVNITRPDGWVVRELLVGAQRAAGKHEATWDGRDNLGGLLAPGRYEVRIATHAGISWSHVTSVGNSGTPPWPTPDRKGGWGGNHGYPTCVAADDTGAYLGWSATEGPACVLKRTRDGAQGIWSMTLGPFEGVLCLAADGRYLYGANGTRLLIIDREQGRQISTVPLQAGPSGDVRAPLAAELTRYSWNFATHQTPPKGDPLVWGLAAGGGRVYVSLPWRDVVEVYEVVETGGNVELKLKADENISVSKPAGLALNGPGKLLVVSASEKRVLEIDLKTRTGKTHLKGFDSPFALARAPDGTVYVSEMKPTHQIHKFSSGGKPQATFGNKGGPTGPMYSPDSFFQPCALAVSPEGAVWFVEDQFKRIGQLAADGQLTYAGFGSVNYAAACAINPLDPQEVFTTMWSDTSFRIDYARPGWSQPARQLRVRWKGNSKGLDLGFGALRMFARGKHTYVWTGKGLMIVEPDHLRPVLYFSPRLEEEGEIGAIAKQRQAKARGWNCDPTIWCDVNGDSAVQDGEIQVVPLPGARHGPQFFGFGDLQEDFSLAAYGYVWKPREFTNAGVPLFRPDGLHVSTEHNPVVSWSEECEAPLALPGGQGFCGISHAIDPGVPLGQGFWSGRSTAESIRGYGPDWQLKWRVGRKARQTARAGEIYFLYRTLGVLGSCVFFSDVEGCVHVIHQDGFYLQRVLQDGWHTRSVGPDVIGIENFSGSVFKHPETGRPYLVISSSEATHVFELQGLDSVRTLAPQPIVLASSSSPQDAAERSRPGEYRIQRVPAGAALLPAHMNGVLPQAGLNWLTDVAPLVVWEKGKAVGEVRMLHDGEYLYVFAQHLAGQAQSPAPLKPAGELLDESPLAAGETMLLQFAAYVAQKQSSTPPAGAARRIRCVAANVSIWGTKVVLQELGAGVPDGSTRWANTPRNSRIEAMPYRNGTCYQLVIPLSKILPTEQSGAVRVKMDVGFLSMEPTTRKAVATSWSGKMDPGTKPDLAQDNPSQWGTAVFVPDVVSSDARDTAVALKTRGTKANTSRWTDVKAYGLEGESAADGLASFQLAWDELTLYARIRVTDPTPLQNRSGVPEMLFKGGDAVSLVFGKADNEGGEQRVVLARTNGKSTAMLYRPKSDIKRPFTFKSPISTETFDFVAPFPLAKVNFNATPQGYTADLAIPWQALGYTPVEGKSIPFDVQVVFSNGAGNANANCAWWQSYSAEAHANNDAPTEARLYPAEWGRLILATRPVSTRGTSPKPKAAAPSSGRVGNTK